MADVSSSRRWATGSLEVGSPSSDSDSDSEDAAAPPTAVQLFSLPSAGGLRARRDSGPVQLPVAAADSDSEDDDFGESVVPLVMPTRCPSRRDSRRCGFGHEISTAVAHKQEDVAAMRNEAEAERLQRRQAEQVAQEEAERKAKVQEEGICVSEIVSLFATARPKATDAANPTLSPAAAAVASDECVQNEEEPSPPWSDGDVADRPEDEDSSDEDAMFGQGGGGRRKSVVQFPGWSSKAVGAVSSSGSAVSEAKPCPETSGLDTISVQDLEEEDAGTAAAKNPVADIMSVQDLEVESQTPAANVQDAPQRIPAKLATAQSPSADDTVSASTAENGAREHGEAATASQAFASGVDWAENAWDEETEMEFVDEIRARQIEQLVRSGRMPAPAPPHSSGFQSARAMSREREGRPMGGRPTSRGFHSAAAVAAAAGASTVAASAPALDGTMVPRPPPKRAGSPTHKARRPAPPPKAAGAPSGRVMSGRTVRGRPVAATAAAPAAPVCV